MSKVVHLSNEAHAVAKVFCKENGLKMSDWVASLITRAIVSDSPSEPEVAPAPAPVPVQATDVPVQEVPTGPKKKKLVRLDESEADEELPAYSKPPFWVKPSAPVETASSEVDNADENLEEPSADADFGGMNSESFGISLPDSFSSPEG